MASTWPVMNAAASEHRKIAGPAMSLVSPTRPRGMRPTMPALKAGSASSDATWGVSTNVGMMALQRMPKRAHSVAHWRVSELIAPLAATYAEYPALMPRLARTEEMLSTAPRVSAAIIARTAGWVGTIVLRRLSSMIQSHASR